ncbi:MAG: hypothetical protein PHU46_13900 [Rhodocyclaceae bacterium]|nr:hypothetical protein [Rhodocyclaceae bacterium]
MPAVLAQGQITPLSEGHAHFVNTAPLALGTQNVLAEHTGLRFFLRVHAPAGDYVALVEASQLGDGREQAILLGINHVRVALGLLLEDRLVALSELGREELPGLVHRLGHHLAPGVHGGLGPCRLGRHLQVADGPVLGVGQPLHVPDAAGGQFRAGRFGGLPALRLVLGVVLGGDAEARRVLGRLEQLDVTPGLLRETDGLAAGEHAVEYPAHVVVDGFAQGGQALVDR